MSVLDEVLSEIFKADGRYGLFTSTHEGYGVLAEEVAELLEAIRSNVPDSVRIEAIQVASVAMRIAESMDDSMTRKRSGMGG